MSRLRSLAMLAMLAAFGAFADADVVRLKTGGALRGEIIKEDEKSITLRVPYGTVIIDRSQVASVEKESADKTLAAEAGVLMKDGRLDEAIAKLDDALEKNPGSAVLTDKLAAACRRRAAALVERGRVLEAEKDYRRILALSPADDEAAEELRKIEETRRDAPAAEKEALLLASLGREREALEMFDGLQAVQPGTAEKHRKAVARAHAEYGRRLLELKRFEEGRRQLDLALKLDPALIDAFKYEAFVARFSVLAGEMNDRARLITPLRWESILAELRALETRRPDCLQLQFTIGLCLHELKRYGEAAAQYALVAGEKADPDRPVEQIDALMAFAREKARKAPVLLAFPDNRFAEVRPGPPQVLETVHFVIHHHNDELAILVARAAEYYVERNWRVFADRMPEPPWPKKCDIHLYRSKEEYLQKTGQADWSPAMASTSAIAGQLERHSVQTYQTVDDLLCSHLPHEITHIIHGAVVNYSSSIPTWLREGTAVRQEPWFKRLRMAGVIREAREKGNLMTMEQVLSQKGYPEAGAVSLFYSQAYALVEAIHRSGTKSQFAQFCRVAQSTPAITVFSQVYGIDSEELRRRWEKHQEDLVSLIEDP